MKFAEIMIANGCTVLLSTPDFHTMSPRCHQDRAHYSEQQIHEMPRWIKTKKDNHITNGQYEVVDINSSVKWKDLLMIMSSHIFIIFQLRKRYLIIIGVNGTDKS